VKTIKGKRSVRSPFMGEWRVWDNPHGKNLASLVYSDHPSYNDKPWEFWKWVDEHGNTMPVMRYTGVKDEKGKKIFEGDIVVQQWLSTIHTGVIGFWEGIFLGCHLGTYRKHRNGMPGKDAGGNMWYFGLARSRNMPPSTLTVIGNIYQNPEILDKDSDYFDRYRYENE